MLIGVSLCSTPLQAQLDGIDAKQVSKTATLWLGDLCGAEAYDPVCLPGTCMCATSQVSRPYAAVAVTHIYTSSYR